VVTVGIVKTRLESKVASSIKLAIGLITTIEIEEVTDSKMMVVTKVINFLPTKPTFN
jgi:hypothetical protein